MHLQIGCSPICQRHLACMSDRSIYNHWDKNVDEQYYITHNGCTYAPAKKDISNSQDSTASLVVVALERNLDAFSLD